MQVSGTAHQNHGGLERHGLAVQGQVHAYLTDLPEVETQNSSAKLGVMLREADAISKRCGALSFGVIASASCEGSSMMLIDLSA